MKIPSNTTPYRPRVQALELARTPGEALACLAERRGLVLLHSAGGAPVRYSVLGFDPVLDLVGAADLAAIGAALETFEVEPGDPVPGPFHGGFLGALAYDLGVVSAHLDLPPDMAPEPFDQPPIAGGLYTDFLVWDHAAGSLHLVLADGAELSSRRAALVAELERSPAPPASALRHPFERDTPPAEHRAKVEAVRAAIFDGELYQANLSHRLLGQVEGTAIDAYRTLIAANPVPYAGFVALPGGALLSASMELLVEVEPERDPTGPGEPQGQAPRLARTCPIKGTVRRGVDATEDAALAAELLASAKDRAELAMIVDLERNDLGRVATVGGVTVPEFPRLESYASVHHLVAEVRAELRPDVTTLDVLAALFPGGSITGAPKLASMELIARLEGQRRGFFTGSLGFLDHRGAAHFSILIRSPLWRDSSDGAGGELSLRVGGGITWASEAVAEDEETLHKAASLLACFPGTKSAARSAAPRG